MLRGGKVGERSVIIGYARISPCSVVLTTKSDNRNDNFEQQYEGDLILKKLSLTGSRVV